MHLHFLRAIGTAMSMRAGIAADAAAALLFRILSQPALLFPPLRQVEGFEVQPEPLDSYSSSYRNLVSDLHSLFASHECILSDECFSFWRVDHAFLFFNLLFHTRIDAYAHIYLT